jgi:Na+-translocating ferredoxin:NAD+ oxidoreductase RnfG subunit
LKEKLLTGLTLFLIAAVSGLLLDQVNSLTQPVIIEAQAERINNAYLALFPTFDRFVSLDITDAAPIVDGAQVFDAQGNVLGYVYQVSALNDHGSIGLLIGIDANGVVVDYVELDFNQTPGISAPARKTNYGGTFVSQPIMRDYQAVDVSIGATRSASTLRDLFEAVSVYHGGRV